VNGCIPDSMYWFYCNLTATGNLAFIQAIYDPSAILVNRDTGVVWMGEDLSSVEVKGWYIVARHANGNVEVIDFSGKTGLTMSMVEWAKPEFETIAADVIDNMLYIAYYSERNDRLEINVKPVRYERD